jgi:hypothetical protein
VDSNRNLFGSIYSHRDQNLFLELYSIDYEETIGGQELLQDYLNRLLPWYFVALANFMTIVGVTYIVTAVASRFFDWVLFDPVYVAAGSFWYSYIQYKSWKSKQTQG